MSQPWTPEHVVGTELARELIASQFPELGGEPVELIGEGWDNTVYRVAEEWIFRFPRRAVAVDLIEVEARILPIIAARLPLTIPVPSWLGDPTDAYPWPFVGYHWLPGRTADVADLDDGQRARAAAPLGAFLRALHAVDATDFSPPSDTIARADMVKRRPQLLERLAEIQARGIVADASPWIRFVTETTPRAPIAGALVHGDLYARHILVDEFAGLTAVIDWGDVHFGDPAVDLAIAHNFLPSYARDSFREAYGPIDPATDTLARLRAIAHAAAITLYGHAVGDGPLLREGLVGLRLTAEDYVL